MEIVFTEVGITSKSRLQAVRTEKKWRHNVLVNRLCADCGCSTKTPPYVMT